MTYDLFTRFGIKDAVIELERLMSLDSMDWDFKSQLTEEALQQMVIDEHAMARDRAYEAWKENNI